MSYHVISGTLGQSLISNVKGEPVAIDEATAAHIKARIQCEAVTEVSPSTEYLHRILTQGTSLSKMVSM